MILKDGRRVYNIETARLILNLPNGFKGYRKINGEFFFEFQGRLGICNIDYLHSCDAVKSVMRTSINVLVIMTHSI